MEANTTNYISGFGEKNINCQAGMGIATNLRI